ncbi:MAG: 6-bladed beta-propeller [Muribaculaceae bacterium]|nr:6-bladed beta-propeller [Muribaculaceae bacterium]
MKSIVNVSVIALMLAGLCACRNQSKTHDYVIKLGDTKSEFGFSDLVEPVGFVSLEAVDSGLIRNVDKVIQTPCGFIVLDKANEHSVMAFSADGKFLCSIGRKGNGPGEYTSVEDIALTPGRDSLLLSTTRPSLDTYSFDGVFGQRIVVNELVPWWQIATNSDNIAMCATDLNEGIDRLYVYSPTMDLKFSGIPKDGHFSAPLWKQLCSDEKSTYYFDWYANKLYEIDSLGTEISKNWELDIPNNVASNHIPDLMSFLMAQKELGYVLNWAISDGKFIAEYILEGDQNIIIYDLANNAVTKHGKYAGLFPDLYPAMQDGTFISVISYEEYELYKDFLPGGVNLPPLDSEETNVILMLCRIKL